MSDDSPIMLAINRAWNHDTTYAERKAFIEVTLHNSRLEDDCRMAAAVAAKFRTALEAMEEPPR